MAEDITIARPYAEAVFRLAKQGNALTEWAGMLNLASGVAADAQVVKLISDPNVSGAQLETLFLSVCGKQLNEQATNMVKLLIENGRLQLLPQIAALFENLKAEQEGVLEASIASAFAMDDMQTKELVKHLEFRFKRKIAASVTVDPELIGGVMVVAGDEVFDASVRGKLETMAAALKH
jgi:F-type H+-transporting ATPase subunit delta